MEVKKIDDFKGHKMVSIGATKISLAKAMKCVEHAEQLSQIAKEADGEKTNPFAN